MVPFLPHSTTSHHVLMRQLIDTNLLYVNLEYGCQPSCNLQVLFHDYLDAIHVFKFGIFHTAFECKWLSVENQYQLVVLSYIPLLPKSRCDGLKSGRL